MKQVAFSRAEAIFSLGGFITQVLPLTLAISGALAAALWTMTDWRQSDIGVVGIFVAPFVFLFVPQLMRYMTARGAHDHFNETYGQRYRELVESGTIKLGAFYVLTVRSPEMYEHLLRSTEQSRS